LASVVCGEAAMANINRVQPEGSVPKIYLYRGYRNALFAVADIETVLGCFGEGKTFDAFFGGGVRYGGWLQPKMLGVWGARNAGRLHRLLEHTIAEWRSCAVCPRAGIRAAL
jgi:hypothetical protein